MTMTKVSPAQKMVIKAAARRLVAMAGGCEGASMVCRANKTSLAAYGNANYDQHIPADVIADLESDIGEPTVTRELARLAGYELVPATTIEDTGRADPIMLLNRIVKEIGEVADAIDAMDADGKRETHELDRCIRETQDVKIRVDALYDGLHKLRARARS